MPILSTPVPAITFALLVLAMHVKHLCADFLLQTPWMARGKCLGRGWAAPLAAHAGLHGLGTLALALLVAPALWWLGPVDFAVHGLIDRGKALATRRLGLSESDSRFWWLIGLDQFLHHVTGIGLSLALVLA